MKNDRTLWIFAFIFMFCYIEFGASALNIYLENNYEDGRLKGVVFENIEIPKYKIVEEMEDYKLTENNCMYEDDSVDSLSDYMQYYIFKPGVFDEEKKNETVIKKVKRNDTTDEIDMLYKIVWKESRNQGIDGMRRVCDVVLNRVDDPRFPNNIKDVILAPGQFTTASRLSSVVYDEETIKAVNMELSASKDTRLDNVSIYFARSPHTKNNYKFGDHYFSH